ncbi:MAG TPA: dTDP-4-dehydrorhamnose reductase [Hanamia sp.]|jgi:dTDP-4-dehydrorhamnose reductase|nr:dTDP-4-dehydrorhamnose reductase [Hanamia sp.]
MDISYQLYNPEIWGGLECTINRIGDTYRDQLEYAGYYKRQNDIDKIAELGIRAFRYPVLWEAHQHLSEDEEIDWTRTERELNKMKLYGITPIAGLIHHGSGPKFTSLTDPNFPEALAKYASKVARKFPWLEYYTPINEPLTTARFSGLYGFWYPHHKEEKSFVRILLNELKATILAMREIRKINPKAKLIQTEDLTKTHSTPFLKYQADFENKRRWISYDILCGKLNDQEFFWNYLIDKVGIKGEELQFFLDYPCPPDIAGFNYYVTSERYLDEKIELFPPESCGGNGQHFYADVAAVRAIKPAGLKSLLREAWERYHIPLALTEVHMHCTREEQLRWFKEAWDSCIELKKEGVNIKAITAWSMLGAFDWNSLLTREHKTYESGVFDVSADRFRPTAIVKLLQSLSDKGSYSHPVINEKGWWHKSYPDSDTVFSNSKASPLLIMGSTGTLGTAFVNMCEMRAIPYCSFTHEQLNIINSEEIQKAIDEYRPWAIINATGYARVDDAEFEQNKCFQLNTEAPANLASICNKHGIQLMTFSSDLVFDGKKQSPYFEVDSVKPLNVYGKSKALGERLVLKNFPSALIIRTSAIFGPWDKYNFAFYILNLLKENQPCTAVKDVIVSPTYVPDLVNKALDLLIDEERGVWHLSNEGMLTWCEFAEELALRGHFQKKHISPCYQHETTWKAKRPQYSVLQSDKGIKLPPIHNAIERFFEEKIT